MNKHTFMRGSLLIAFVPLFSQLVFEQSPQPAAAEADRSNAYGQYLPITFAESCVPRSMIPLNDLGKDLALENGINQVRVNHGVPLLNHSDKIALAAIRHSSDMAHNGFVDNVRSDGSDQGDRAEDFCYHRQAYGGIIVSAPRTPNDAIAAWMGNQDYKEYILSNDFTEFGSAYSYNRNTSYKHFYMVDFGLRDFTSISTQVESSFWLFDPSCFT